MKKHQTPSTKSQTNSKFKCSKFKTVSVIGILVIGIYLRFEIWDLEFKLVSNAIAQTPEATDSPAVNRVGEDDSGSRSTLDKINLLKEKVASKVAQLQKSIQFAADGNITEIEEEILTFSADGEEKTITTDETTRYLSRSSRLKTTTADLSDLAVNDNVTILGSEQIGTDLVTAKLIIKTPQVVFFTGVIGKVDSDGGTLTIKEKDSEYIFDYEVYTDSMLLNSETEKLESGGFSKLEKDQQLQILAVPQKGSENRFTALRLVIIP